MKVKIKLIDYGIASRIGNTIYVNKQIKKNYPNLYKQVILHEKSHTDNLILKDFIIDLNGKYLDTVKRDYWLFVISNPKSWVQFLPIGFYEEELVLDPSMLLIWFLGVLLGGLIWYLF